MNQEEMGKLIALRRKEKDLTQKELAKKLNVGEKTISKWERGINAPDIALVSPLCKILDISVEDFLVGKLVEENQIARKEKNKKRMEGMKFYNKKTKWKFLKIFLASIFILFISYSIIFTINNFNQFRIYNITSKNEDFNVNGYLIFYKKKKLLLIKNALQNNKYVGTDEELMIKNPSIYLQKEDQVLYLLSAITEETEWHTLNSYLRMVDFSIESSSDFLNKTLKSEEDLNDIEIVISYYDTKNEKNSIIIPLEMTKQTANNKLFY